VIINIPLLSLAKISWCESQLKLTFFEEMMLTRKQLFKRSATFQDVPIGKYGNIAQDGSGCGPPSLFQLLVRAFSGSAFAPSSSSSCPDVQNEGEISSAVVTDSSDSDSYGYDCKEEETSAMMRTYLDVGEHGEHQVAVTILKEDMEGVNVYDASSGMMTAMTEFSPTKKNILSGRRDDNTKKLRSALSMAELRSAYKEEKKSKRTMRFSSTVHVCLVPTRDELRTIFDELYFRAEDFAIFKKDAVMELRELLTRLGISSKEAIRLMYQPNVEEEASSTKDLQEYNNGPSLSDDEDDDYDDHKDDNGDGADTTTSAVATGIPASCNHSPPSANQALGAGENVNDNSNDILVTLGYDAYDEGPSLSDDEEESRKYQENLNKSLMASAPFLVSKTDVELNSVSARHPSTFSSSTEAMSSSDKAKNLPLKTPNGGGTGAGDKQMWEVAWRK
jgi:hypothetical protein